MAAPGPVRDVAGGAGHARGVEGLAWRKGQSNGIVIQGAGGPRSNGKPGDETIRTSGCGTPGTVVEFAYLTGYDSHGRVSVNHIVDERGR